ncbi:protein rolling stone-like isoform X2 [Paramacrobiotus metropolitanus]|uniref:protein rolling stone-like isoform X2 n=1 Tax=Paramacrobiotus metropolitanus TaxID=2943436 RepID=UPI0024460A5F|nr:protein rolling stone-like isoform X2 [Paramacrobiotus metropolitanus]
MVQIFFAHCGYSRIFRPTAYLPRDFTIKPDRKYLIYLTNWTYLLFTLYTIVAAVNCCTYREPKHSEARKPDRLLWPLRLQWMLWNVGAISTVGVMILYWTLLGENLSVFSVHKHMLNGIVIVIDHCFIAMPVHLLHVYQSMVYGVFYSVFTAVYFLSDRTIVPIYKFLDFKNNLGLAVGTEAAVVFVLLPLLHFCFWMLFKLRLYIAQNAGTPRPDGPDPTYRIPAPITLAKPPTGPRPIFVFTVEDVDADKEDNK